MLFGALAFARVRHLILMCSCHAPVQDCEALAADLCQKGLPSAHYHADMDPAKRMRVHQQWSQGARALKVQTQCNDLCHNVLP